MMDSDTEARVSSYNNKYCSKPQGNRCKFCGSKASNYLATTGSHSRIIAYCEHCWKRKFFKNWNPKEYQELADDVIYAMDTDVDD
jgi:hypothetical protein